LDLRTRGIMYLRFQYELPIIITDL